MKTIQVSEATNLQLDWMIAKCEGKTYIGKGQLNDFRASRLKDRNTYSVSWAQGGPIIEREKIGTTRVDINPDIWAAHITDPWRAASNVYSRLGDTPLIASMRCYVASKLGDTVEIPKELK